MSAARDSTAIPLCATMPSCTACARSRSLSSCSCILDWLSAMPGASLLHLGLFGRRPLRGRVRREVGERLVQVRRARPRGGARRSRSAGLEVDEELVLEDLEPFGDVVVGAGLQAFQLVLQGFHPGAQRGDFALEAFLEALPAILELPAEGLEVVLDAPLRLPHRSPEGLIQRPDLGAGGLEPLETALDLGGVLGHSAAELLEDLGLEGRALCGEPRLDYVAVVLDLGDYRLAVGLGPGGDGRQLSGIALG